MILLIEKRIIVTRFLTLIHCELNQLGVNNKLIFLVAFYFTQTFHIFHLADKMEYFYVTQSSE